LKDLVVEIINSYEERLITVESLISNTLDDAASPDAAFSKVRDEGERLKESLKEACAHNCSLRRKDFDALMASTFDVAFARKSEIEEERDRVREKLASHLGKQKKLIVLLKEQLLSFNSGSSNQQDIEALLRDLRTNLRYESEEAISLLRNFHLRIAAFCREQEFLNHKLQNLLERGKYLRLEDLRELEAARDNEQRKEVRASRRDDLNRMLSHFKEERREMSQKHP
jgi:hypothetical protein